jgi:hypothetical protein
MIIDSRNEFADAVALNTGAAGTYLIGSQIDVSVTGASATPGHIGAVDDMYLVIAVDTGIAAASAGTVQFQLASDDTASVAVNGTATVHFTTAAFVTGAATGTGALKAGTVLAIMELPKSFSYERYLGVLQVTGTTAISAGKINAFLTADPALWASFDAPSQA